MAWGTDAWQAESQGAVSVGTSSRRVLVGGSASKRLACRTVPCVVFPPAVGIWDTAVV